MFPMFDQLSSVLPHYMPHIIGHDAAFSSHTNPSIMSNFLQTLISLNPLLLIILNKFTLSLQLVQMVFSLLF